MRKRNVPARRHFTMHDLPISERPRERLLRYGSDKLSGEELLAVLISRGTSGVPVRDIAHELLVQFGSISAIADATVEELKKIPGIGMAKACQIKAAFELARRFQENLAPDSRETLTSPEAVVRLIKPRLIEKNKECFFTVLLDVRNRHIRTEQISLGSLDATIAHPREVFDPAVHDHANTIIIVHNHPSGDPTPSADDISLTRRLRDAGEVLGIKILDHIVIAGDKFYSFREQGLL
ncbi:MAG: RadC family protein [bacterium]